MIILPIIVLLMVSFLAYRLLKYYLTPDTEEELYRELLRKCSGDKHLVERLIELEQVKNPNADRVTLIKYAIERFDRQNNRHNN